MLNSDHEKQRATWRAWYHRNKAKKNATQKRMRANLRAWFAALKRGKACLQCGEADPVCLTFHHRDPKKKEITLSDAIRKEWGKSKLLAEIAKCDVLCIGGGQDLIQFRRIVRSTLGCRALGS